MKVNKTVNRNGNIISIRGLNNPQILQDYTSALKTAVFKCGYQDIIVEIYNSRGFFPNVVVPLCGINDYFQSQGVQFTVVENSLNLLNHVLSSHDPSVEPSELNKPLSKIWRFHNNQDINNVQNAIISELRKEEVFADGVLEGIEWSINEVMDNVLNHSEADGGYIMSQLHKNSKHVAFTIFDSGRGIYNSFRGSKHIVRSNADALSLCLQEGVTRDPNVGQGNGMCGLFSLIKEGNGILNISSGRDTYSYRNGETNITQDSVCSISKKLGCTTVDFQLDYSKDISIDKVLTFQGRTFSFINLFLRTSKMIMASFCLVSTKWQREQVLVNQR